MQVDRKGNEAEPAIRRPPLISYGLAAFWMFASYYLYVYGRNGIELASFGCLVTTLLMLQQVMQGLTDAGRIAKLRKQNREFENLHSDFGESNFASFDEIRAADWYSDRQGFYLGQVDTGERKNGSRPVFYNGPCSVAVIAPPGENKTTGIVIPSCFSMGDQNLIINDVSGELLSILGSFLAKTHDLYVVTPFAQAISQLCGRKVEDVGLDIFSALQPDTPSELVQPCLEKSIQWVLPEKHTSSNDPKLDYFLQLGRMISQFYSFQELKCGRKPSLPGLRHHAMVGMQALPALCEEANGSPAFGGSFAELASSLNTLLSSASPQLAGGWGNFDQAVRVYDPNSALGIHTASSSFDPRVLKGSRKSAVFVCYTLEHFETFRDSLAMTLTYLLDTVAGTPGPGKVTAIIDETGALNMPKLANALNFYRKANLRCLLVFQDLVGQTEKTYGKATTRQILSACKLKIAMGLEEPETLEMFSKLCGTKSVASINRQEHQGIGQVVQDPRRSFSHQSVPLLRPEEIRLLKETLVVGGSLPPMLLQKVRYWERSDWREAAGPSPFYQGDQDVAEPS